MGEGCGWTTFLGELPTERLWDEYACCRALLFAADEDFGMVPLEAQACGRPVIAYGAGGSLETVRGDLEDEATGVYFRDQTVDSLAEAIGAFEARESRFDPDAAHAWAEGFRTEVFLERIRAHILTVMPAAAEAMAALPDGSSGAAAQ